MRTLGLMGGMSWESTAIYYRHMNEMAKAHLGGSHSAELLLWSVDFAPMADLQRDGDWDEIGQRMVKIAHKLEQGGAKALVLCTNTIHKVASQIEAAVSIPLLHIADATAVAIKTSASSRPLLLGTRFTMEQDFYKQHLKDKHGIDVAIPGEEDRHVIHRIIYEELCRGVFTDAARQTYLDVIARHLGHNADGVIFGCTEIGILISQKDIPAPAFDTAELHCAYAIDFMLKD